MRSGNIVIDASFANGVPPDVPETEEEARRRLLEKAEMIVDGSTDKIVRVNPAWNALYGTTSDYWIGTRASDHISPEEHRGEALPRNKGVGHASQAIFHYGPGKDQRLVRATWTFWVERNAEGEITGKWVLAQHEPMDELERARAAAAQHELEKLTDRLTGIPNRAAVEVNARRCLERINEPTIVFFADVDHFKDVNDSHGHSAGDAILKACATRLARGVKSSDFVARWGGDEFLGILHNAGRLPFRSIMMRLRGLFAEPVVVGDREVRCSMSFGCVLLDGPAELEEVQARADAALLLAKEEGRNRFAFWDDVQRKPSTGDLPMMVAADG